MKRYDKYKQSGIDWIGEIPEYWKTMEIKFYCHSISSGATPSTNNSAFWDGDIPWIPSGCCHDCEINEAPKFITEDGLNSCSTQIIPAGTTVMAMTGATCSQVGYLTIDAATNQSVMSYVENKKLANSRFLFYLLIAAREYVLTHQTGGAQAGIDGQDCSNLIVPFVPLEEQVKIVDYLDKKCTNIDNAIAEQENRVHLLNELRQNIITLSVSRGVNSKVKLKASGDDCIGDIPEHWDVRKIKFLADVHGRVGFKGYTTVDLVAEGEGAYTIGGKHISTNELDLSDPEFISWFKYYESPEIMVKKGDLLTAQRGSLGKSALIREEIGPATINPSLILFNNIKVSNEFLYWCFVSKVFLTNIYLLNTSTAVPMVSQTQVKNIKLPVPPMEEQIAIVQHITQKLKPIDNSIMLAKKQVDILREYKQALITEVVTGKRKVC